MLKVSANKVQARFDELLGRVGRGERIAIVRRGKTIAHLESPMTDALMRVRRGQQRRNVFAEKKSNVGGLSRRRAIVAHLEKPIGMKVGKSQGPRKKTATTA